jgi:putative endonuclease
MHYTYLLLSLKDNKWYTGYSNDLKKRFTDHNKGLVYATSKRRPFKLIYYESCIDQDDAKARETYLKSGPGKRYLKNRLKFYFNKCLTGTPTQVKTLYNADSVVKFGQ